MISSLKPKRGLARLTSERRKEIARKGQQALRKTQRQHEFDSLTGKKASQQRWQKT